MYALRNRDPEDRLAERSQYKLAQKYAQTLTRIDSIEDLIREEIVRFNRKGIAESDFVVSGTHLGVITPKLRRNNEYQIVDYRGTLYYTDASAYELQVALSGGHSAVGFIKDSVAKQIYESGQLKVLVAVPKSEVSRLVGERFIGTATPIAPETLQRMNGVRVYLLPSSPDISEYEKSNPPAHFLTEQEYGK